MVGLFPEGQTRGLFWKRVGEVFWKKTERRGVNLVDAFDFQALLGEKAHALARLLHVVRSPLSARQLTTIAVCSVQCALSSVRCGEDTCW